MEWIIQLCSMVLRYFQRRVLSGYEVSDSGAGWMDLTDADIQVRLFNRLLEAVWRLGPLYRKGYTNKSSTDWLARIDVAEKLAMYTTLILIGKREILVGQLLAKSRHISVFKTNPWRDLTLRTSSRTRASRLSYVPEFGILRVSTLRSFDDTMKWWFVSQKDGNQREESLVKLSKLSRANVAWDNKDY